MAAAHACVPSRQNVGKYVEKCKVQSHLLDAICVGCDSAQSLGMTIRTAFGAGTASCWASVRWRVSLAIMVAPGILGGIGSKNAALPRLAITQICLGAVPIELGSLLPPRNASWVLAPPLFMYIVATAAIVGRRYEILVALITRHVSNVSNCPPGVRCKMPRNQCNSVEPLVTSRSGP
jgi:hypothetical protein